MAEDVVTGRRDGAKTGSLGGKVAVSLASTLLIVGVLRWLPDQWLATGVSYGVDAREDATIALPAKGDDDAVGETCVLRQGDVVSVLGRDWRQGFLVRETISPRHDGPMGCKAGTDVFVPFWLRYAHGHVSRSWIDLDAKGRREQARVNAIAEAAKTIVGEQH